MTVTTFGSINMDLVVKTPRFPVIGETLKGATFFTAPGGKGANQAVACARLGVPTFMVGRVGRDVFGSALLDSLKENLVDTSKITIDEEKLSGTAFITVNQAGENTIIVASGANFGVDTSDLKHLEEILPKSSHLLLQLEIPMEAIVAAARMAHQMGVTVILDPAPAVPLPEELYRLADIITPNEVETSLLVGFSIDKEEEIRDAASILHQRGTRVVIIKMGGRGAYFSENGYGKFLAPFKVMPVDTVAAGDAFNGGLAAALAENQPLPQALTWAMAAGALSTTREGAQPSMPTRQELLDFISSHFG